MARSHPVQWARPVALPAIVPLAVIVVLVNVYIQYAIAFFLLLRFPLPPDLLAQPILNNALLLVLGITYAAWVLAAARGWVTHESGAGFVIAATALCARVVVEIPVFWSRSVTGSPPPESYDSVLALGRTGGLAAFAVGLALVVTACLLDRPWPFRISRGSPGRSGALRPASDGPGAPGQPFSPGSPDPPSLRGRGTTKHLVQLRRGRAHDLDRRVPDAQHFGQVG